VSEEAALAREPQVRIKAFYLVLQNFHLAHRYWTFADDERMDFAFEDDVIIESRRGGKRMLASEFNERTLRKETAEQIASTQFGLCFVAMFDFLESLRIKPRQAPKEIADVALLIWAVRNAFSHQVGSPVWAINDDKFRRTVRIGSLEIPLGELHGEHLHPEHIGGALCVERVWNELNEGLNRMWASETK